MFEEYQPKQPEYLKIDKSYVKGAVLGSIVGIPIVAAITYFSLNPQTKPKTFVAVNSANSATAEKQPEKPLIKGNKNSRIFHLPHCPNYNDISERNVIWFNSIEEARLKGFRPARNC